MIVSEVCDDKIVHLNTHPDLLPPAEDTEKLLAADRAVLIKSLSPGVLPCDIKTAVKAIRPRVAPKHGIQPRVALKTAFKEYKQDISYGGVARKAFKARETSTSSGVRPIKALSAREKTVTFTNTETFPTRKTAARAIIP